MALSNNLINLLTRSPGDVAKEQIRKLYLRLYPYIIEDFSHTADLLAANQAIMAELIEIKRVLLTHTHVTADAIPSVVLPPNIAMPPVNPAVVPTRAVATSLEVPGGIPQPTGGGISIQRSRIDPDPIAIPPINPLGPSV